MNHGSKVNILGMKVVDSMVQMVLVVDFPPGLKKCHVNIFSASSAQYLATVLLKICCHTHVLVYFREDVCVHWNAILECLSRKHSIFQYIFVQLPFFASSAFADR